VVPGRRSGPGGDRPLARPRSPPRPMRRGVRVCGSPAKSGDRPAGGHSLWRAGTTGRSAGFARRLVREDPPGRPRSTGPAWPSTYSLRPATVVATRRHPPRPGGGQPGLAARRSRAPGRRPPRPRRVCIAALRPGVPFDLAGLLAATHVPTLPLPRRRNSAPAWSVPTARRPSQPSARRGPARGPGNPEGAPRSVGPQGVPRTIGGLPGCCPPLTASPESLDGWLAALDE
jgi:hypothetical protein